MWKRDISHKRHKLGGNCILNYARSTLLWDSKKCFALLKEIKTVAMYNTATLLLGLVRLDVCAFRDVAISSARAKAPHAMRTLDVIASIRWWRRRQIGDFPSRFQMFLHCFGCSYGFDERLVLFAPVCFLSILLWHTQGIKIWTILSLWLMMNLDNFYRWLGTGSDSSFRRRQLLLL